MHINILFNLFEHKLSQYLIFIQLCFLLVIHSSVSHYFAYKTHQIDQTHWLKSMITIGIGYSIKINFWKFWKNSKKCYQILLFVLPRQFFSEWSSSHFNDKNLVFTPKIVQIKSKNHWKVCKWSKCLRELRDQNRAKCTIVGEFIKFDLVDSSLNLHCYGMKIFSLVLLLELQRKVYLHWIEEMWIEILTRVWCEIPKIIFAYRPCCL